MKRITLISALLLLGMGTIANIARAQTVTFTNIADSVTTNGGAFTEAFTAPSINGAGKLAFYTGLKAGGNGIFTGIGDGTATTIADTTGVGTRFSNFASRVPAINDSGTVAFYGELNTGGNGVFTGSGGATTTIADTLTTNGGAFSVLIDTPSINASGTVAFLAGQRTGGSGIFTGTGGGSAALIANTSATNGGAFFSFDFPAINSAGKVSFWANLDVAAGGTDGIFTATGNGSATKIADTSSAFNSFILHHASSINTTGTVAFGAITTAGVEGLFTGSGGAVTKIADSAGPFNTFGNPSINSTGTVAFLTSLDSGSNAIFASLSGVSTPFQVLRVGDSLFGSTVTSLGMDRFGLNDSNQIGFQYRLANNRYGVAVANISSPAIVPESGTLILLIPSLGLIGVLVARRRK